MVLGCGSTILLIMNKTVFQSIQQQISSQLRNVHQIIVNFFLHNVICQPMTSTDTQDLAYGRRKDRETMIHWQFPFMDHIPASNIGISLS